MKKIIITIITVAFAIGLKAQNAETDTALYKIYKYEKKIRYIFNIDTTTIIFKREKKYRGDIIEYANGVPIDTLTYYFIEYMPDFNNNRLLWLISNNKRNDFYFFDLNTFKFKLQISLTSRAYKGLMNGYLFAPQVIKKPENKKNEPEDESCVSGGIKNSWELEKIIFSYDTVTGKESKVIDIDKYTIDPFEDIEDFTLSPNTGKILLDIGIYESGSYSDRRYLVYDMATKQISTKDYEKNKLIKCNNCEFFLYNMFYDYGGYFYMTDYKEETLAENTLVLDSVFNIKDTLLPRRLENNGFIYKNKKIKGFYFYSNTDVYKDEVIVPSMMTYDFEKLQSNIYYNIKLRKEDLTNYDLNELNLLKNMIFAKHNYKFDNKYYQAYFNLYRFYNSPDKHKTRTKKVNHLLTDADKKNLKLINTMIKSKSEH